MLDHVGWVQDIVVNQRTGNLVDGHLRVELALERGEASVPVVYIELSEGEEARVLAALDPLGAMATVDAESLAALLDELEPGDGALDAMLADLAQSADIELGDTSEGLTDPDAVPDTPADSSVRAGDLYELGRHRLLCGDATDPGDVERLLSGARVTLLRTDPPWGIEYLGGSKPREPIEGDESTATAASALRVAARAMAPGAAAYCFAPGGRNFLDFGRAFIDAGFYFAATIIWVKHTATFGRADYQWQHEPIIYGWREGAAHAWQGDRSETTVWEIDRPARSDSHPTAKPVLLFERAMHNSSLRGDAVLDLFVGSGTALIAAERVGRRCFALEVEPRYVEVAIRRWEQFTGHRAQLVPRKVAVDGDADVPS